MGRGGGDGGGGLLIFTRFQLALQELHELELSSTFGNDCVQSAANFSMHWVGVLR